MSCPLCKSTQPRLFFEIQEKVYRQIKKRTYFQCPNCDLIFLDPSQRLARAQEKKRYDTHENNSDNSGYIDFLKQVWTPLKNELKKGAVGLDYGAGPNPVLAQVIKSEGFKVDIYDPIYSPEPVVGSYDFITCTEVIEHAFEVFKLLEQLDKHLKPRGFLGLMTEVYSHSICFKSWRYRHDDTHVCFFSLKTIEFISDLMNWSLKFSDDTRALIFQKL